MKRVLAGVLVLGGCGYIGPVLPPALDIPLTVSDLRAAQVGDQIVAEFTLPALTTEGLPLKSVRSIEVRVGEGGNPFSMNAWAASAKRFEVPASAPGPLTRDIPAKEWEGKVAIIAVRATGPKGKDSGWSAPLALNIQTPLARPTALRAANVEKGVQLSWTGPGPKYRIFRASGGANSARPELLKDSDDPQFLDETTQYDTPYSYLVQALTDDRHLSEVSEAKSITPVDMFAPAVPSGLSATAAVGAIELAWSRNTESDFKGYNVYRSVAGAAFVKIADSIAAPTFSDRKVEAGKNYSYAVSAVDLKGNESERSAVVEALAQ